MSQASTQKSFISRILTGGVAVRNSAFSKKQVQANVKLKFPSLDLSTPSIHWNKNTHLLNFANLAHRSLSGPVQEDKADAHALLKNVVDIEHYTLPSFDLCNLYGFNTDDNELVQHECLDSLAGCNACKSIRIISMRDFEKVLNQVIPDFDCAPRIQLYASELLGEKYFWSGQKNIDKLIGVIVYARRRGIAIQLPAEVSKAVINRNSLGFLSDCYHVLAMPAQAWADKNFMRFLIDYPVPYVRLPISRGDNPVEVLLLPRQNINANTLGEGLLAAGAQDAALFLVRHL